MSSPGRKRAGPGLVRQHSAPTWSSSPPADGDLRHVDDLRLNDGDHRHTEDRRGDAPADDDDDLRRNDDTSTSEPHGSQNASGRFNDSSIHDTLYALIVFRSILSPLLASSIFL